MARHTSVTEPPRSERGSVTLWFVVSAGPIAWVLHLLVSYALLAPACALNAPIVLHAVTLLTMLPVALAAVIAYRLERVEDGPVSVFPFRRYMWQSGIILSVLFLFVIAIEGLPVAILSPCWR